MRSFRNFLVEDTANIAAVKEWLATHTEGSVEFMEVGKIKMVKGEVLIDLSKRNKAAMFQLKLNCDYKNLPFKFSYSRWVENWHFYELKDSMVGIPERVDGFFMVSDSLGVKTLDGLPGYVGNNVNIFGTGIESLSGIHNRLRFVGGGRFRIPMSCRHAWLGLLIIRGVLNLESTFKSEWPLHGAVKIMNRHLKSGRDVLACQEELIDAGFDEVAEL